MAGMTVCLKRSIHDAERLLRRPTHSANIGEEKRRKLAHLRHVSSVQASMNKRNAKKDGLFVEFFPHDEEDLSLYAAVPTIDETQLARRAELEEAIFEEHQSDCAVPNINMAMAASGSGTSGKRKAEEDDDDEEDDEEEDDDDDEESFSDDDDDDDEEDDDEDFDSSDDDYDSSSAAESDSESDEDDDEDDEEDEEDDEEDEEDEEDDEDEEEESDSKGSKRKN